MTEIKIDCEPKWIDLLPLFFDYLNGDNVENYALAKAEITKMAILSDTVRKAQKENKVIKIYPCGKVEYEKATK